jgi:hypothetical protein
MASCLRVTEDEECKDWNYFPFSKRIHVLFVPQEEGSVSEEMSHVFEIRFLVSKNGLA